MSAGCGPGCGWCGHCTAAWEYEPEDDDRERDGPDQQRCGATGMVAYWDGSALAGEMCRGCVDCEPVDVAPAAVLDDEGELEPPF